MADGVAERRLHSAGAVTAPHLFDVHLARTQADRRAGPRRNDGRESCGDRRTIPSRRFRSDARRNCVAAARQVVGDEIRLKAPTRLFSEELSWRVVTP